MEAGATTRSGDRPESDAVLALGVGDASAGHVDGAHGAASGHPSPARYVFIALVLALITGVEVVLYYIDLPSGLLVASLMALATVKFVTVVSWFMHLKFDSRLLRRMFVTGIVLAVGVFSVVLLTFHVLIG
ncbi:MAG: cytochrome C oxidase subunit IV family protein [Acidimicrobiia bacterium]